MAPILTTQVLFLLLLLLGAAAKAHVQLRVIRKDSSNRLEAMAEATRVDAARLEGMMQKEGWRSSVTPGASAGAGQYFVELMMGSPPQKMMLVADTGSDLIWVRCASPPCFHCSSSSAEPLFKFRASSSYSPLPCLSKQCLLAPSFTPHFACHLGIPHTCTYDYTYSDGSFSSGIFSTESITLNSTTHAELRSIPGVVFGCGLRNRGESLRGAAGVLGLGNGHISFPSQLASVVGNIFSYCFADFFQQPPQDSYLTFGKNTAASSSSSLYGQFHYTPIISNPGRPSLYYVKVEGVMVNGDMLPIPGEVWEVDEEGRRGTVIDSGTTLTFFAQPAYTIILGAMRNGLPYEELPPPLPNFELCFNSSSSSDEREGEGLVKLPELVILLAGNASFAPPPNNYFIHVSEGIRCLGLQPVASQMGFSVLGNLLQQHFHMEYDRDQLRLGFAPSTCLP